MIIEILDQNGAIITKVANSVDPDRDTEAYGGASWRNYVMPDDVRIDLLRESKILEIRSEALRRIYDIIPAMAQVEILDLIIESVQSGMMSPPSTGSNMESVKDIYIYARTRIDFAKSATEDQLNQYNPATDANWP